MNHTIYSSLQKSKNTLYSYVTRGSRERKFFGNFNDVVLWQNVLGYITVPKTANTSLKIEISRALNILTIDEEHSLSNDPQSIHRILRQKKDVRINKKHILERLDNEFYFSVVRNPWDRFLSFHRDKILGNGWEEGVYQKFEAAYGIKKGDSLVKTLEIICSVPDHKAELHFRSQYSILTSNSAYLPHTTFRYENLNLMWNFLRNYFSSINITLPSKLNVFNRTSKLPNTDSLNPKVKDLIYKRYRKDIEFFGYEI